MQKQILETLSKNNEALCTYLKSVKLPEFFKSLFEIR